MAAEDTETFSISNLTKGKLPSLPFARMKESILGKRYRLSLVFAPSVLSRNLNKTYRGKNTATDILSFPLGNGSGEIVIAPAEAKNEAKRFKRPFENFIGYLFIHGCVHLKGMEHGSKMEATEEQFRREFGI